MTCADITVCLSVCVLTQGLQVDMDKVEEVVFDGVVRFAWDIQVAIAHLVRHIHLYL